MPAVAPVLSCRAESRHLLLFQKRAIGIHGSNGERFLDFARNDKHLQPVCCAKNLPDPRGAIGRRKVDTAISRPLNFVLRRLRAADASNRSSPDREFR